MSKSQPSASATVMVPTLKPPPHFGIVESGVYRSAYPTADCVPYLAETLKIKTIVLLSIEDLQLPVVQELQQLDPLPTIAHVTHNVWRLKREICVSLVEDALSFVFDASCHPMILMCPTGGLQTSAVVGCLRRKLMWTFSSIMNEYKMFCQRGDAGGYSSRRHEAISNFIEQYAPPIGYIPYASPRQLGPKRIKCSLGAPALFGQSMWDGAQLDSSHHHNKQLDSLDYQHWDSYPGVPKSPMLMPVDSMAEPPSPGLGGTISNDMAPVTPSWWAVYFDLAMEEESLLRAQGSEAATAEAIQEREAQEAERRTAEAVANGVPADLAEAVERRRQREKQRQHPHEIHRLSRNPPAISPGVKFDKGESIVEEDDD